MLRYKDRLENIEAEISRLKSERAECKKELSKIFNEKAKDYLKNGYRIVKINRGGDITLYGFIDDIEYNVWLNSKHEDLRNTINSYGLFVVKRKDFLHITDMSCAKFERIFTFFDEIEEISIEELNEVISEWVKKTEHEYAMDAYEDCDDTWNWEEWFYDDEYYKYFDRNNYFLILNNKDLNEQYKKMGRKL
jgi:hypothetical protein